jgi:hypothetical protein
MIAKLSRSHKMKQGRGTQQRVQRGRVTVIPATLSAGATTCPILLFRGQQNSGSSDRRADF